MGHEIKILIITVICLSLLTDELNDVSQELWNNPELAWNEHHAHKYLSDFLEKKGFAVERHYLGLETAFNATIGEGTPHVAILCEYDALPDIGHACGHNLIAEVGIGAGLAIKEAMQSSDTPLGKVCTCSSLNYS